MWEITKDIGMNERYGFKGIRLIFLCEKFEIPKEKFQEREGHSLL